MAARESFEIGGQRVPITNPDKIVFGDLGVTKGDLMDYYSAVAEGALRGVADRPMILKRFVKGIAEEAVFQKRPRRSGPISSTSRSSSTRRARRPRRRCCTARPG